MLREMNEIKTKKLTLLNQKISICLELTCLEKPERVVLTKLAPRLVQNNGTLTLNNSDNTVAALDCHEEDMINSLKICDKINHESTADDSR